MVRNFEKPKLRPHTGTPRLQFALYAHITLTQRDNSIVYESKSVATPAPFEVLSLVCVTA